MRIICKSEYFVHREKNMFKDKPWMVYFVFNIVKHSLKRSKAGAPRRPVTSPRNAADAAPIGHRGGRVQ